MTSCTALVLAGGASSRFGSDKTRATVDGRQLLELVTTTAAAVADDVLVVGPWAPDGVPSLPEPGPRRGPLGGLAHGLALLETDLALVLAADLPTLQPELLGSLVARSTDQAVDGLSDAVVPLRAGRPEPLVACYRTGVAEVAQQVLGSGGSSMRDLLARLRVDWWPEAEWRAVDPEGRSFQDVDVPTDLPRHR